ARSPVRAHPVRPAWPASSSPSSNASNRPAGRHGPKSGGGYPRPQGTSSNIRGVRIAAMDLGSNSFHLLVADAHPDGTFEPLVREKEVLRLADLVVRDGRIGTEGAARAIEVIARFRTMAEQVEAQ